jgi:hypothetical protein
MAQRESRENEELILLLLFVISSSAYFSSTYGVFSSNAGSHLALVKSIVEERTFSINSFVQYTGYIDYAQYKGSMYADRAPGMAFATVPFYVAGKVVSSVLPMPAYYRGPDPGNPAVFASLLFATFTGGLAVCLLYLLCRSLGASVYSSLVTSIAFAFGTILWKYSGDLFSHSLCTFLVLAAVYLAIGLKDIKRQKMHACSLFFIIGYLPSVEYPNALLSGILLSYLVLTRRVEVALKREYHAPLACLAVPLLVLMGYHQINFGGPFTTAYAYQGHFDYSRDLTQALSVPWSVGIPGILFTNKDIDGGLFVVTPVLLISCWGFLYLYRSRRNEALLLLGLFIAHLLLYSRHQTWFGGGVRDTRYILHVTGLLLLPLSSWVDGFLSLRRSQLGRVVFEGLMWSLIAISVINVMDDVATFEGHGLRMFKVPVLNPSDLSLDLDGLFPNLGRLPVYLGILGVVFSLLFILLKRIPAIGIGSNDTQMYSPIILGMFVGGLLLILMFTPQPDGKVSVFDWQYSPNGFDWVKAEPPFAVGGQLMYVKGTVDVPSPKARVLFNVAAKDCISGIYINEQFAPTLINCSSCLHCKGIPVDLTRFMAPGKNQIGFEVVGLTNNTQFELQAT